MFAADCSAQKAEAQGSQQQVVVGHVKCKDISIQQEDANAGQVLHTGMLLVVFFFFFLFVIITSLKREQKRPTCQ